MFKRDLHSFDLVVTDGGLDLVCSKFAVEPVGRPNLASAVLEFIDTAKNKPVGNL